MKKKLGGKKLFIADFDGTLAPIVPDFRRARPLRGVVQALQKLRRAGWIVVILSGRGLADLRSRIRLSGAIYGGDHGWDWSAPLKSLPGLPTARRRKAARAFVRHAIPILAAGVGRIPGVQIQEKRYFAVVHHRLVAAGHSRALRQALANARRDPRLASGSWREGKKILELFGPVRWGKGDATQLLIRHLHPDTVIAVGDDVTDEEMFRAVPESRGTTIRVGRNGPTCARRRIPNQAAVISLIHSLLK